MNFKKPLTPKKLTKIKNGKWSCPRSWSDPPGLGVGHKFGLRQKKKDTRTIPTPPSPHQGLMSKYVPETDARPYSVLVQWAKIYDYISWRTTFTSFLENIKNLYFYWLQMWLIGSVFWKVRKYVFFKWLDPYLFNKKKVASVLWIWSESEHLDWNPFKKWIYTERLRLANIFRSGQTHGTSIIWKIRTCCARMKKTRSFPKKNRVWRLFRCNQMLSTNRKAWFTPCVRIEKWATI